MKYAAVKNYINGHFVDTIGTKNLDVISSLEVSSSLHVISSLDVISPLDGSLLSTVPMSTTHDLNAAVDAAAKAFPAWSKTPIKERVQVFFKYKTLLEKHLKELAELCSEENGKLTANRWRRLKNLLS